MNTNDKTPTISVLMSVYNEPEAWLRASIDSILNQTYKDFEFIIVYDNPNFEQNENILDQYSEKDERIKLIKNKTNIGLTKSLNIGLEISKGKYVARMDADDISESDRFTIQWGYMENNSDCIVCGTWMNLFNEDGLKKLITHPIQSDHIKSALLMKNCIAHPTVFIRRMAVIDNCIKYNERLMYSQDYDFWCKLSQYGSFANIPQPLVNYRRSNQQISTKKVREQKLLSYQIRESYYNALLGNFQLVSDQVDLLNRIKELHINTILKIYLISAFYTKLSISKSILVPIFNGDFFAMKKLYLSALRRSWEKREYLKILH